MGRERFDLAKVSADDLRQLIRGMKPSVVVNAAAYTLVDRAEQEQDLALQVNGVAPAQMAAECERLGALLVHFSTDYVFDGHKGDPYDELDPPGPINAYGRTKLVGENEIRERCRRHIILRTSWLYSVGGRSFPTTVLKWARKQKVMRVVDDQIGNPTWARLLAETTAIMLAHACTFEPDWFVENGGTYHLACGGQASRYEWAQKIVQLDPSPEEQCVNEIIPVSSDHFATAAVRPRNSSLNCRRFEQTFGLTLPRWERALELAMQGPAR
jgi:dTDP-4-dehydrorhamnose reductase